MNRKKFHLLMLALLMVALLTGCAAMKKIEPVNTVYVEADEQFAKVVLPLTTACINERLARGEIDPVLAQSQLLAIKTWEAMVVKAREAIDALEASQ